MARARLQRLVIFLALIILPAIPVVAVVGGFTEHKSVGLAVSILVVLAMGPLLWGYYQAFVRICFPTGIALELHEDHLVVATPHGMKKIPRKAITKITGPRYTSVDLNVHSSAQIVVDDDLKVSSWLGFRQNPIVHGSLLEGASEWNAMSALKTWHAKGLAS